MASGWNASSFVLAILSFKQRTLEQLELNMSLETNFDYRSCKVHTFYWGYIIRIVSKNRDDLTSGRLMAGCPSHSDISATKLLKMERGWDIHLVLYFQWKVEAIVAI